MCHMPSSALSCFIPFSLNGNYKAGRFLKYQPPGKGTLRHRAFQNTNTGLQLGDS